MADLPEEILMHIFWQLRLEQRIQPSRSPDVENELKKQTLRSLALASKLFHRLVQPIIFRTLTFSSWDKKALALVLRTFHPQPQLLEYPVEIATSLTDDDEFDEWSTEPSHTEIVSDFAETNELPDQVVLDFEYGSCGVSTALLLCICTNVASLEIEVSQDSWSDSKLYTVLGPWNDIMLGRVRILKMVCANQDEMTDLGDHAVFLRLPALEEVYGRWLMCYPGSDFQGITSLSLRRIDLDDTTTDGPGLGKLLQACPCLGSLALHWIFGFSGTNGHVFITSKQVELYRPIGDALRAHGRSLTTLQLGVGSKDTWYGPNDDTDDDGDNDYRPSTAIGSLRELDALQFLSAPVTVLFGDLRRAQTEQLSIQLSDVLPASLETLRIPTCDSLTEEVTKGLGAQMMSLLQADSQFRQLQKIGVESTKALMSQIDATGWRESTAEKGWQILERPP